MGLLSGLSGIAAAVGNAAPFATNVLAARQQGQANAATQRTQQLLQQVALERQRQQDARATALQQAQVAHLNAQTAATPKTPKANVVRGPNGQLVDVTDVTHPSLIGPTPTPKPVAPVIGSPEWKAAQVFKAKTGAEFRAPPPVNNVYLPTTDKETGQTTYTVVPNRGAVNPQQTGLIKPATGGAGGDERAGLAAAFLSRLKMGKADFDNGMQFIRNYHEKLAKGQEVITPAMMAEKATAETGQNPEAHGLTGALNNAIGGFTQGLANQRLSSDHRDYQRYANLLNSMSLAMTEVLPRPTQQLLGIERGINTAKAGDSPERLQDIQHRLDKAYEYLFANPEAMLKKGSGQQDQHVGVPPAKPTPTGFDPEVFYHNYTKTKSGQRTP